MLGHISGRVWTPKDAQTDNVTMPKPLRHSEWFTNRPYQRSQAADCVVFYCFVAPLQFTYPTINTQQSKPAGNEQSTV